MTLLDNTKRVHLEATPLDRNEATFFLCYKKKTRPPQKSKTRPVLTMYKTLTKGDERDIGIKVIPMDYKRKRRIERDKRGFTFRVDDVKGGKNMKEKEAVSLADEFPGWVSKLLQDSATGASQTIRWFIKTLYAKGYEIRKSEAKQ